MYFKQPTQIYPASSIIGLTVLVLNHSSDNFKLSTEPTLELLIILLKLKTILLFLQLIQVGLHFVSVLEILFLVANINLIYLTLKKLL